MGTDSCEVVETLPDPHSFKVHKVIEFNYIVVVDIIFDIILSIPIVFLGLFHCDFSGICLI
jgi:hypothetical protein